MRKQEIQRELNCNKCCSFFVILKKQVFKICNRYFVSTMLLKINVPFIPSLLFLLINIYYTSRYSLLLSPEKKNLEANIQQASVVDLLLLGKLKWQLLMVTTQNTMYTSQCWAVTRPWTSTNAVTQAVSTSAPRQTRGTTVHCATISHRNQAA